AWPAAWLARPAAGCRPGPGTGKGTPAPQRHPGPPQSVSPSMTATGIYHFAVTLLLAVRTDRGEEGHQRQKRPSKPENHAPGQLTVGPGGSSTCNGDAEDQGLGEDQDQPRQANRGVALAASPRRRRACVRHPGC